MSTATYNLSIPVNAGGAEWYGRGQPRPGRQNPPSAPRGPSRVPYPPALTHQAHERGDTYAAAEPTEAMRKAAGARLLHPILAQVRKAVLQTLPVHITAIRTEELGRDSLDAINTLGHVVMAAGFVKRALCVESWYAHFTYLPLEFQFSAAGWCRSEICDSHRSMALEVAQLRCAPAGHEPAASE